MTYPAPTDDTASGVTVRMERMPDDDSDAGIRILTLDLADPHLPSTEDMTGAVNALLAKRPPEYRNR